MTNNQNHTKNAKTHIADEAGKASESIKSEASQLAQETKARTHEQAEKQFDKGQDVLASQVDTLSSAVDEAASKLKEEDHPLGHYTREMADSMSGLSEKISNSSLDELASDTRRLAKDNPGLFMLGSIAIGVAASRFFKASSDRDNRDYVGNNSDAAEHYASDYGRSRSVRHRSAYDDANRLAASRYSSHRNDRNRIDSPAGVTPANTAPVASDAVPVARDTAPLHEEPRVNKPVSPAEKSAGNKTLGSKSVTESEGA